MQITSCIAHPTHSLSIRTEFVMRERAVTFSFIETKATEPDIRNLSPDECTHVVGGSGTYRGAVDSSADKRNRRVEFHITEQEITQTRAV